MMFVSLVLGMVIGPWQLWVLASPTRTVGFRTVFLSILAGVSIGFPISVAVQWAWTTAVAPLWDGTRFELIKWAGWTIDPFVEEVLRLAPLALVLVFAARVRRQWSMTDLVLFGTGLGSGFRLAEHVARYGVEQREPFVSLSDNGWGLGFTVDGNVLVPYPWVFLTQWMPESVQVESITGHPAPLLRYNLIAIWGALGGLAVALWVLSERYAASPRQARSGRVAAVGLLVFAGLAHAQINADLLREDWVLPALALPRLLEPFYWAWPIIVLAVAMFADRRLLQARQTDPELAALRIDAAGSETLSLARLAIQRPLISARTVWSFVAARRSLTIMRATKRPDDSSDSAGLFEAAELVAIRFRNQLNDDGDLWDEVAALQKSARRARWAAWRRPPLVLVSGLTFLLALLPVAYFVGGTIRGGHRIQEWMAKQGSPFTVGVAALGAVVGVVAVVVRLRAMRQMHDGLAESRARAVLAVAITIAAVASILLGLVQTEFGVGLGDRVYAVHGLEALGALLWAAAVNLALLVGVVANPVAGSPLFVEHHRFKSSEELVAMLPREWQLLLLVGPLVPTVVMTEDDRAVPGDWEDGPKPPPPLEVELDQIVEHAWKQHVLGENGGRKEFPEIQTKEELRELLEELIEESTEWGYREDRSVYWYHEQTDTVVIKNPPGNAGTTYRPKIEGTDG